MIEEKHKVAALCCCLISEERDELIPDLVWVLLENQDLIEPGSMVLTNAGREHLERILR